MSAEPAVRVVRDVVFLPPERAERLDVYLPEDAPDVAPRPALLYVHGGAFHADDKAGRRSAGICTDLVGAGFVVVSVNYLLAEGTTGDKRWSAWPVNLRDCEAALDHLRRGATTYGVDVDRVGVMGASAGSTLAMLLAFAPPDALPGSAANDECHPPRIRAVVNLYGRCDWTRHTAPGKRPSDLGIARAASPVTYLAHANGRLPPVLSVHGDADEVVPFAQAGMLAAALRDVGGAHELCRVIGAPHSFGLRHDGDSIHDAVIAFLRRTL